MNDPSTRPVQALFRTSLWQSPSLTCIGRTQWTVKKRNRDKLSKQVQVHGAVTGRYERDEVKPSIERTAAIAKAFKVSLDYLVGNTDLLLEKSVVNKIVDIQKLGQEDKAHVFTLLDAFLQSHKARKVFAS